MSGKVLVVRFALCRPCPLNGALREALNLAESLVSSDIQKSPGLQFEGFLSVLSNSLLLYGGGGVKLLFALLNKINVLLCAPAVVQGNPAVRKEARRGVGEILQVWSHLPALLEGTSDIRSHLPWQADVAADIAGCF